MNKNTTQPSDHAMAFEAASRIADRDLFCSHEARNSEIEGLAHIIDQHAIAPAVAERDRRISELEAHLRALHAVALVGTESEHVFDAITAFLAKSERSAP